MLKPVVAALLVSAISALPALAGSITDRQACELSVGDVQKMRAASDAGPRVNLQSDELIAVAVAQCEAGDLAEAEKTLTVVRAILSTE